MPWWGGGRVLRGAVRHSHGHKKSKKPNRQDLLGLALTGWAMYILLTHYVIH